MLPRRLYSMATDGVRGANVLMSTQHTFLKMASKLSVIFFILSASPVGAESKDPDSFFKDGFVSGILTEKKHSVVSPKKSKKKNAVVQEGREAAEKDVSPLGAVPEIQSGTPVRGISAVIETRDKKHAEQMMNSLKNLVLETLIPVREVYLLGSTKGCDIKQASFVLTMAGGRTFVTTALPQRLASIERSPSWIVSTSEGEILLEGIENISDYISTKGEFIAEPVRQVFSHTDIQQSF